MLTVIETTIAIVREVARHDYGIASKADFRHSTYAKLDSPMIGEGSAPRGKFMLEPRRDRQFHGINIPLLLLTKSHRNMSQLILQIPVLRSAFRLEPRRPFFQPFFTIMDYAR